MKASTDHVVFSSVTQAFECLRCHARHAPELPMAIEQFVSVGKGFTLMHRLCQPKPEPSPQLPLPHTIDARELADGYLNHPLNGTGPVRHAPLNVALCWADLWPQLKMVLSDEDYTALAAYTPFAEKLHQKDFNTIAVWVARELSEEPGVLEPRPAPLSAWLERALSAEPTPSPPAEKPKRRRKP